jgi:hypothetical protein
VLSCVPFQRPSTNSSTSPAPVSIQTSTSTPQLSTPSSQIPSFATEVTPLHVCEHLQSWLPSPFSSPHFQPLTILITFTSTVFFLNLSIPFVSSFLVLRVLTDELFARFTFRIRFVFIFFVRLSVFGHVSSRFLINELVLLIFCLSFRCQCGFFLAFRVHEP